MSDLNQAIVNAIEKLNRTDGEGMAIATKLQDAAEDKGMVKDCDWCGEMILAGKRFCSEGCTEGHTSHNS